MYTYIFTLGSQYFTFNSVFIVINMLFLNTFCRLFVSPYLRNGYEKHNNRTEQNKHGKLKHSWNALSFQFWIRSFATIQNKFSKNKQKQTDDIHNNLYKYKYTYSSILLKSLRFKIVLGLLFIYIISWLRFFTSFFLLIHLNVSFVNYLYMYS